MTISTTSDRIDAQGGSFLVGKALEKRCQFSKLTRNLNPSHNKQFSDCDILKLAVGLLAQGRTHFSDVELFRQEGSVIRDFILVAGKVVKHSGRTRIKLAAGWPWTETLLKVAKTL